MTSNSGPTKIVLGLFENGIDYITSGIQSYLLKDTVGPHRYKYALLHIFSGTLLILKERLRLAHASLVWADVTHMNSDSSRTVDFDQVISRLEKCALVTLSPDEKSLLKEAQSLRNKIEHYAFAMDVEKAKVLIGRLVGFLDGFIKSQLHRDLTQLVPHDVWLRLSEFEQIAQRLEREYQADWDARAEKYRRYGKKRLRALANSIEPYHPKHNPDPIEMIECPECGIISVLAAPSDQDIAICTNHECKGLFHLNNCERCGASTLGTLCDNCEGYLENVMSKDD